MSTINEDSFNAVQHMINNLDAIANGSKSGRKLVQDGSSGSKSRNLGLVENDEHAEKSAKGRKLSEKKAKGHKRARGGHSHSSGAELLKTLGAGLGLLAATFLGAL